MGKKGKPVYWLNYDKRCLKSLGYIVPHNKGRSIGIDDRGNEVYHQLTKHELIQLGFLAAAGLTLDYGKMRVRADG